MKKGEKEEKEGGGVGGEERGIGDYGEGEGRKERKVWARIG